MQRVCAVSGGVNAYQAQPDCLVTPETLSCLFCEDRHRLRRHGWYERRALFPDPEAPCKIGVVRLLCTRTGQTISLLPDFCLARRQHGPAILALFLEAFLRGRALLEALRTVRKEAPSHGVAQSLRDGFLRQAAKIRAYLARLQPRAKDPPAGIRKDRLELARLFFGLSSGFESAARAFTHHALSFHRRFQVALA